MNSLVTENVKEKIRAYNLELNKIIQELTSLMLDENAVKLDVRDLQKVGCNFSVLTSIKNRRKVENAFEDVRNEYGYELQKYCEKMKTSYNKGENIE